MANKFSQQMKKLLLLCIAVWSVVCVNATTRIDGNGNTVYHSFFAYAEYQINDFEVAKESGCYGLGVVASSLSHWGNLHVGANVDFSVNAGLIDPWGCIVNFGPSARIDINKNFFVNIPVNAVCSVMFIEGSTDSKTNWGAQIAPSIHAFISEKLGIFVGPKVMFNSESVSIGMQAGISYSF